MPPKILKMFLKKSLSISSIFGFFMMSCFPFGNQEKYINYNRNLEKADQTEEALVQNFLKNKIVIKEKNNINLSGYQYDLIPILEAARLEKFNNIHIPQYQTEQEKIIARNLFTRTISLTMSIQDKNQTSGEVETINGTGWIIAKVDNSNNHQYYVGTNIHVASSFAEFIQKAKNSFGSKFLNSTFSVAPYINFQKDGTFDLPTAEIIGDTNVAILNWENPNARNQRNLNYLPFTIDTSFYWAANKLSFRNWENFSHSEFITQHNNVLDFAVLKIDFAKTLNNNLASKYSISNSKKNSLQNYVRNLQNIEDIKFGITKPEDDTLGYMVGFPSLNDDSPNYENSKYLYNTGIYNVVIGANHESFEYLNFKNRKILATNECAKNDIKSIDFQNQTTCLNSTGFSLNIPYLNNYGGSSGSGFMNYKNELQGVYWGIIGNGLIEDVKFNNKSYGQVIALRVQGHYDVIKNNDPAIGFENNKTNTLCEAIQNKNAKKVFKFC